MGNGVETNKEIEITMLDKIEHLNEQAEQIKEETRLRRSATQRSLAALYAVLRESDELSEEETEEHQAAAENVS